MNLHSNVWCSTSNTMSDWNLNRNNNKKRSSDIFSLDQRNSNYSKKTRLNHHSFDASPPLFGEFNNNFSSSFHGQQQYQNQSNPQQLNNQLNQNHNERQIHHQRNKTFPQTSTSAFSLNLAAQPPRGPQIQPRRDSPQIPELCPLPVSPMASPFEEPPLLTYDFSSPSTLSSSQSSSDNSPVLVPPPISLAPPSTSTHFMSINFRDEMSQNDNSTGNSMSISPSHSPLSSRAFQILSEFRE